MARQPGRLELGVDHAVVIEVLGVAYDPSVINQSVALGAVEKWTIQNGATFSHAFHIHDVHFNIVSRSTGPVPDHEHGWKDTLGIAPNESVSFVARIADFATAPLTRTRITATWRTTKTRGPWGSSWCSDREARDAASRAPSQHDRRRGVDDGSARAGRRHARARNLRPDRLHDPQRATAAPPARAAPSPTS